MLNSDVEIYNKSRAINPNDEPPDAQPKLTTQPKYAASRGPTRAVSNVLPLRTGPAARQFRINARTVKFAPCWFSGQMEAEIFHAEASEIVAVVDDDPSMLNAAESLLDAQGFATMVFASARLLDSGAATRVDAPPGHPSRRGVGY